MARDSRGRHVGRARRLADGLCRNAAHPKKRGILLAIVSKNDEAFIRANWDRIVQGQISLSDFAMSRINFRSKAENLAEILQAVNLRPQNAVMIDDNPVERAAIQAGLPGLRVLGSHVYYLKRILLWSSETQQPALTPESGRKTEMVQAQLQRECVRKALSQEEFLQTLQLRITLSIIHETKDLHMSRALELFNKTNQFNTTGVRYTLDQCQARFAAGHALYLVQATDRFTHYGLIGAAWVRQNYVDHVVMSCRALGLGIEDTLLAYLANGLRTQNHKEIFGLLRPTDANAACRPFFQRNGFALNGENIWTRSLAAPFVYSSHVSLELPSEEAPIIPGLAANRHTTPVAV
jgi:FkbH-like protein